MRQRLSTRFAVGASLLFLAIGGAEARTRVQAFAVAPVTVDGNLADWKGVPIEYLENGPRVTAIAHDDRFLYVTFRFSDLDLARRVLSTGAIVWIDGTDKHDQDFGLRYRGNQTLVEALDAMEGGQTGGSGRQSGPPPGMPEPPPGMRETGGPPTGEPGPQRVALGALEVLRSGVSDEVIPGGVEPAGPAAACAVTDGVFIYELRIPLVEVWTPAAAGGEPNPAKIAVGFQMGGMTEAEREAMSKRMRSEARGREGGAPGGYGAGPAVPPGGGYGGFGGGAPGGFGSGPPEGFGGGRGGRGGGPSGDPGSGIMQNQTVWVDVELIPTPPTPGQS